MKQNAKNVSLFVLLLFMGIEVSAYDFEADGIYYGYNASDQTAYVTYGTEKYSGNVVIPESVTYNGRTMSVTSIGPIAFEYCNDLYSVSIPNSVTSIGDRAFSGSGLKSVNIPNSVTTIESCAFRNSNLTSLIIPSSIMTIGKDAFSHCELLDTLVIEDSEIPIEIHFFDYDPFEGSNPKYVYVGRDCISYSVLSYIPMDSRLVNIFSIGKSVKYVRYTLNTLTTIYSASVTPENMEIDFLNSTYLNAILYVPTGTKDKYLAADGWKNFFNIQEMDVADMWDGNGEPKTEGKDSSVSQVKAEAIMIQTNNGTLNISGVENGTDIAVYTSSGMMVGSANATSDSISIATGLMNGEIAIIKIGDRAIKVVVK